MPRKCRLRRQLGSSLALLLALPRCSGLYDPVRHIASARLYGNVDSYAYYYVDLLVGTPPQRVSTIIDTGSGVTAFSCSSCRHCGTHIDPAFDFDKSSTASWIPCSGCHGHCRSGHCSYSQSYTEGSSISGWWFRDQVHLGDTIQHNPPVYMNLGCHMDENRLFYTQRANGILGIRPPGRGAKTLLQELFADKAHIDSSVFALCLAEWGGRLVVGGYNESYHTGPTIYFPLSLSSGYYGVPLQSMRVNGVEVHNRFGSTMIDSGTTYVYMGSGPYRALKAAIESYCRSHDNCGAVRKGQCYEIPTLYDGLGKFPPIEVIFHGQKTWWYASGYLYRKGLSTSWCYSFEDDGPNANTVLGAAWMIQHEVIFDLPRNQVGVADANCPLFKKRPKHDPKDLAIVQVQAPSASHGTSERTSEETSGKTSGKEQDVSVAVSPPKDLIRTIAVAAVAVLLTCVTLGALIVRWFRRRGADSNTAATEAPVDKAALLLLGGS